MNRFWKFLIGVLLGVGGGFLLILALSHLFGDLFWPTDFSTLSQVAVCLPALVGGVVSLIDGLGRGILSVLGLGVLTLVVAFCVGLVMVICWGSVLALLLFFAVMGEPIGWGVELFIH